MLQLRVAEVVGIASAGAAPRSAPHLQHDTLLDAATTFDGWLELERPRADRASVRCVDHQIAAPRVKLMPNACRIVQPRVEARK
jgi:hypothetical protein